VHLVHGDTAIAIQFKERIQRLEFSEDEIKSAYKRDEDRFLIIKLVKNF
jgi:hypothetical protein